MSEAAVGGGPETGKPLATWTPASWPRCGWDAPPCTPAPHPSPQAACGHCHPLYTLLLSPSWARSWWGADGGSSRRRESRRPSRKSLPGAGLGVLPRRGAPRAWHGPTSNESSARSSPGAEKNLPLAFLGMSVFFWGWTGPWLLAFENEGHDVRMEGQSRAGLGDPGQDTNIRADQPGKGAASQLLRGEAPPSL